MSAVDQTPVAETGEGTGKSTREGNATRTPVLTLSVPQLPYGDAVHAALAAAGLPPDVMDAGVRTEHGSSRRELHLALSWLRDHPALTGPERMDLLWSHLTGWAVRIEEDIVLLDVDELADPALLVDAAAHFARHGITGEEWVVPFGARWEHALELDIATMHFDEREAL